MGISRFSNGPVWIEDLSARLGAKLHDYAFGGGVISTADVPMGSASGLAMEEQLKNYTTTKMFPSASTLYTVFCGGNDFLDNLGVSVKTGTLPNGTQISAQMTTFLSHLVANAHATNILLLNLPPMEDTPILLQNASSFASVIAPMSVAYNQEVDAGVKGIVAANPGVNVMTFDFYAFVKDLVTSPTVFTVVNASCMDPMTNAVCSDPDSYLFFDYLHPTARAHSYLANATYDFLTSSTASAAASSVGLAQIAAAVVPMAGGEPVSTLTPSPSSFSGTSANASSASLKWPPDKFFLAKRLKGLSTAPSL
ncbi:hypothetical protein HK101_005665 [Irineochytrium annulatum]|nr:hypothetical protein HK101_005665 [Irineochytrium annulatum]